MLKLIAAAVLAVCMIVPAHAAGGACEPLIDIAHELATAGAHREDIVTTDDVALVRAYNEALGVKIPEDAEIIGAIFVRIKGGVIVGLIENKDAPCIRYKMVVPLDRHKYAMMMLAGV